MKYLSTNETVLRTTRGTESGVGKDIRTELVALLPLAAIKINSRHLGKHICIHYFEEFQKQI